MEHGSREHIPAVNRPAFPQNYNKQPVLRVLTSDGWLLLTMIKRVITDLETSALAVDDAFRKFRTILVFIELIQI